MTQGAIVGRSRFQRTRPAAALAVATAPVAPLAFYAQPGSGVVWLVFMLLDVALILWLTARWHSAAALATTVVVMAAELAVQLLRLHDQPRRIYEYVDEGPNYDFNLLNLFPNDYSLPALAAMTVVLYGGLLLILQLSALMLSKDRARSRR